MQHAIDWVEKNIGEKGRAAVIINVLEIMKKDKEIFFNYS